MAGGGDPHGEEVFRPKLAPLLAVAWYVIAVVAAVDLVRRGDSGSIALGFAVLAVVTVVVYAIAQRPAVIANDNGVLLRNVLRDVWLPWHRVDRIGARWSLTVEADGVEHGSWAIAANNPARERERGRRIFGLGPVIDESSVPVTDMSSLVSAQLERRRERGMQGGHTGEVEIRPAWGVLIAFAVAALAVVVTAVVR